MFKISQTNGPTNKLYTRPTQKSNYRYTEDDRGVIFNFGTWRAKFKFNTHTEGASHDLYFEAGKPFIRFKHRKFTGPLRN